MNLKELFDKQASHWDELVEGSEMLYDLDWNCAGCKLRLYATVHTNDKTFLAKNATFLATEAADDEARDFNAEIAQFVANGDGVELTLRVMYGDGDCDIATYEVVNGIFRDDSLEQLRNPDGMVLVCKCPKVVYTYKKPAEKSDFSPATKAKVNDAKVGLAKSHLAEYLEEIQKKAEKAKKDGDGNYSYSFSVSTDGKGNTTVEHSINGGEKEVAKFETAAEDKETDAKTDGKAKDAEKCSCGGSCGGKCGDDCKCKKDDKKTEKTVKSLFPTAFSSPVFRSLDDTIAKFRKECDDLLKWPF